MSHFGQFFDVDITAVVDAVLVGTPEAGHLLLEDVRCQIEFGIVTAPTGTTAHARTELLKLTTEKQIKAQVVWLHTYSTYEIQLG